MRRSFVVVVVVALASVCPACPEAVADDGDAAGEGDDDGGEGEGEPAFVGVPLRFVVDGVDVGAAAVDFGTVAADGSGQERELVLEPVDPSLTVAILSDPPVLLGGRDVDMWRVVTQPAATVGSGGSRLRVRFTPTIGGVLEGKLVVAWGVGSDERLILDVTGTGEGPVAPVRTPGLRAAIYDGAFELLPDFDTLTPTTTTTLPAISISLRADTDNFAFRFQGALDVPADGSWTFTTESDDGSRLLIDGAVVVDNDGPHGPLEVAGVVELVAGPHTLEVQFFENAGGELLNVTWQGPGVPTREALPASALFTGP